MWEANAKVVEKFYGGYVNWDERFYLCPECGELIYESDWSFGDLLHYICPVCEFTDSED